VFVVPATKASRSYGISFELPDLLAERIHLGSRFLLDEAIVRVGAREAEICRRSIL
jgi:hypothetical protein